MTEERFNEFFNLTYLCSKIHTKMCEVYDKTPESCYIDYKNTLYDLLKKMDTSIESFNKKEPKKEVETTDCEKKSCGYCKHFQLDGMFGMWCEKDRDWENIDANDCSDYER